MIYILNFDRSQLQDPRIFHALITGMNGISDWWHYLPATYLLSGSKITTIQINNVIHQAYPNLNFMVSIMNVNGYQGYLHKDAWDWLNKHRYPNLVKIRPQSNIGLPPIKGKLSQYLPSGKLPVKPTTIQELLSRKK